MVNIIANRHKAGVPRIKDDATYDLHYQRPDFVDHPWRTEMQATNIFPVDTQHFPNGQWYWVRIVSQIDGNTTSEGDLYVFDPGFEPNDPDAGKAYGKWAEIRSYDGGEIRAYIGSNWGVPYSGYNASELDYYEASTIDDAVAWVNRSMLNLVNASIIANRHKAGYDYPKDALLYTTSNMLYNALFDSCSNLYEAIKESERAIHPDDPPFYANIEANEQMKDSLIIGPNVTYLIDPQGQPVCPEGDTDQWNYEKSLWYWTNNDKVYITKADQFATDNFERVTDALHAKGCKWTWEVA